MSSDATPDRPTPAARKMGPFVLGKKLGAGGMGVVYLATYVETGRKVALKVLPPSLGTNAQVVARFDREMAILKRLRHPNVVQYFGGGKSGGQQYYAMEYLPGGGLDVILKAKGRLPWDEALDLLKQVAAALEHSHQHGIIHRDLKPANLFYGKDGTLKLGDFGIARDTEATALTVAGKTVGTYAYMAPEQIAGKPPVSRHTDLYALGCVAFELLTGRPPFVSETPAEMLFNHLNEDPPLVRELALDCPVWFEQVIDKLLHKDPEERYYDALAVQVALDEVREKVAQQTSLAGQTLAGGAATGDAKALKELVSGKKKKKKKAVPVYERVWFLGGCLAALAAVVSWTLWPPGEAALYAKAETLMQSPESDDWLTAKTDYLEPLLSRFPESDRAEQARAWVDQADLALLKRQVEKLVPSRREPRNEQERLLVEAWRKEADDRLVATAKYRSLMKLWDGKSDARLYRAIAAERLAPLEAGVGVGDDQKIAVAQKALEEGDALFQAGKISDARDKWSSVVVLYGDEPGLAPYVQYARGRMEGRDVQSRDRQGAVDANRAGDAATAP